MTVEIEKVETLKFWHEQHPLCDELARLEKQYIPETGSSMYRETEMLRAANRLYYDYGNNGLCNNLTAEVNYLVLTASDILGKKLCIFLESVKKKILKWKEIDGESAERQLDMILERVVQHVLRVEKEKAMTKATVAMDTLREERR